MSEEELDDLSMPEEIGETDSQDEMYEHFSVTVDKGCLLYTSRCV